MTGRGPELRVLRPGHEAVLDAFLAHHTDGSMFLRANARAAGLLDRGAPLEASSRRAVRARHRAPRRPAAAPDGRVAGRHSAPAELALLVSWRVSFSVEALATPESSDLRRASEADNRLQHERGADWVLAAGDTRSTRCCAVVAGALLAASKHGVRPAVLFTAPANAAARRAYGAIGFRITGDYGLVLLAR